MKDNPHDDKVNPENTILHFPGGEKLNVLEIEIGILKERIARLEGIASSQQIFLQALITNPREKHSEVKEAQEITLPANRPLSEEDKIVNRYALCAELVRLLIELNRETVLVCVPKLAHGDKTDKPRVYFTDDNSFLYFDKAGRIYPGAPTKKCKGKTARYILGKLYEMRDYLPSPMIQAALIKSQFNAAVLDEK